MNRFAVALASLSLALVACRGGDDGGGGTGNDGGSNNPDGNVAGAVTVKQVQNDSMPSGTQLELKGVVVTAIDTFGAKTGDLWVEDADGGAFSGVKVFGAPLDVVASLQVGDIVDITNAQKNEFACTGTICGTGVFDPGYSITEVESVNGGDLSIVKTGHGTVPAPAMVDALAIANMPDKATRDAEWEKWEGVYINVVHATQAGAVGMFGAGADDQKKIKIDGDVLLESVLAPFNAQAVDGACFAGITGIGDYFFQYLVLPTSEASTVSGGTGCKVFAPATITEIQNGTKTGAVSLTDVFVTAVSFNKKNFWVSTSLTAAANQGLYVFNNSTLDAAVVVGAKVSLRGTATEFNTDAATDPSGATLTELSDTSVTVTAAPTTAPVPLTGLTVANLNAAATGEQYEGALVTLTNVKVTDAGTATDYNSSLVTSPSGTTFKGDDDIYRFVAADLTKCYATITGIWSYNTKTNNYVFLPRNIAGGTAVDGVTTGGTCN